MLPDLRKARLRLPMAVIAIVLLANGTIARAQESVVDSAGDALLSTIQTVQSTVSAITSTISNTVGSVERTIGTTGSLANGSLFTQALDPIWNSVTSLRRVSWTPTSYQSNVFTTPDSAAQNFVSRTLQPATPSDYTNPTQVQSFVQKLYYGGSTNPADQHSVMILRDQDARYQSSSAYTDATTTLAEETSAEANIDQLRTTLRNASSNTREDNATLAQAILLGDEEMLHTASLLAHQILAQSSATMSHDHPYLPSALAPASTP